MMELHALKDRILAPGDPVVWVTFDSPQSRALLCGEEAIMMPPIAPRDYRAAAASLVPAQRILKRTRAERVVSTGAAVASSFLPIAQWQGLSCHYIESAARTHGPSVTGRVLEAAHAGFLYTQHRAWATGRWQYAGSVFDGLEPVVRDEAGPLRRVFVSLGTSEFPFTRLVRRLESVLPHDVEVVWQMGATMGESVSGRAVTSVSHDELLREMIAADLVITHAGVGSALAAFSVGHCPLLIPRRAARGEHVDEHQLQIARDLHARGLAVAVEADQLVLPHLEQASHRATRRSAELAPLQLRDRQARPRRVRP